MSETTDTLIEPKRRRGPGQLPFKRLDCKPIFRDFPRVAQVCEECGMTEREADVFLMYRGQGMEARHIGERLGIERKNVWREIRHINNKLRDRYGQEIEDETAWYRDLFSSHQSNVITCQKNSRGTSRTPVYYKSANDIWRAWTSPVLTTTQDLRRGTVHPIDIA